MPRRAIRLPIIMSSRPHRPVVMVGIICFSLLLSACGIGAPAKPAMFTIGILRTAGTTAVLGDLIKTAMTELGYVEGKNVTYLDKGAQATPDALTAEAKRLVEAKVNLIFSTGTQASQVAKKVTEGTDTPIVFAPGGDPVQLGLVQSIANPGGNVTGVATGYTYPGRVLEYLRQIAPNTKRVFVAYDPNGAGKPFMPTMASAAKQFGIELIVQNVTTEQDVTTLLADLPANIDAIFLIPDNVTGSKSADYIKAAASRKLPFLTVSDVNVELGALMSYGWANESMAQQAARLGEKVLKGGKPSTLPVESPEFLLSINLKTANAIGLNIPDEVLRQAKKIIK